MTSRLVTTDVHVQLVAQWALLPRVGGMLSAVAVPQIFSWWPRLSGRSGGGAGMTWSCGQGGFL